MKRVIKGLTYNTETAAQVCRVPCGAASRSDFGWHDSRLYRTPRGRFFVAGEGGPLSRWGVKVGNTWEGGSGLDAIGPAEARDIMERAGCDPEEFTAAGLEVADA
jgi:hypothetical protein